MKRILIFSLGLGFSTAFAGPDIPVISVGHEQKVIQESRTGVLTATVQELGSVKVDIIGVTLDFGNQGQPLSQLVEVVSRDVDALDGDLNPGSHLNHKPWEALGLSSYKPSETMRKYSGKALPLQRHDVLSFHYTYQIVREFSAVFRFATNTVECESRVLPFLKVEVSEPSGVLRGIEFFGQARNISSLVGKSTVAVVAEDREAAVEKCYEQVQ